MVRQISMNKKRILITGATAGIGAVATQALAAQGHELIIVGRNPQKTAQVMEHISQQTGQRVRQRDLGGVEVRPGCPNRRLAVTEKIVRD